MTGLLLQIEIKIDRLARDLDPEKCGSKTPLHWEAYFQASGDLANLLRLRAVLEGIGPS